MNRLLIVFCVLLIAGCDSRPTVVGLFGEKIGERIQPDRCVKVYRNGAPATLAEVKKPTVLFPIKESDDVGVTYTVLTNMNGQIESLKFASSVMKRDAVGQWLKKVVAIRTDARKKYGEPDYTGSFKDNDAETGVEVDGWYVKDRVFNITLATIKEGECYAVSVEATTYEQSAKTVAELYANDIDGTFRKRWSNIKDKLPSDYVKLVEGKINMKDQSYL